MKIFITGSSGFIGTELANHLSSKHKIVKYGHPRHDIFDYDHLKEAMKGCDVVVHLAAIRKPLEDKTFSDYFKVNCIGTLNVAQAALENRIKKFIFLSSMSYYGIEKGITIKPPIKEGSPILTQHAKAGNLNIGIEIQ